MAGLFKKNKQNKTNVTNPVLSENTPFAVQEAYKSLRTNIMFSLPDSKCKKILVTSSCPGEGKSTTCINLGIMLAENHKRVIIVDCDLRIPTIAKKLDLPQKPGLTDLLFEVRNASSAIRHYREGLDILPAGSIPPNPSEILGSEQMSSLIDVLSSQYDYVLFDAPPVCMVTDACVVAGFSSGIIMVVREGESDTDHLGEALSSLQVTGAKILGFVMTASDVTGTKYKYKKSRSYSYRSYAL